MGPCAALVAWVVKRNHMFALDDAFLREVGLGELPDELKAPFLTHVYESLELRVGREMAEDLTDEQLIAFDELIESGDEDGALAWIERTVPGYKSVVARQLEQLKIEIRQAAPAILADGRSGS